MSIDSDCFWFFAPAIMFCVREEKLLKVKTWYSSKNFYE